MSAPNITKRNGKCRTVSDQDFLLTTEINYFIATYDHVSSHDI